MEKKILRGHEVAAKFLKVSEEAKKIHSLITDEKFESNTLFSQVYYFEAKIKKLASAHEKIANKIKDFYWGEKITREIFKRLIEDYCFENKISTDDVAYLYNMLISSLIEIEITNSKEEKA